MPEIDSERATLLLVEDDEAFSYAASRYLVSEGYQVTAVATGLLALEALDQATFEFVVIDCMLPAATLSGVALGRMVRFRNPRQRMIFITANPDIMVMKGDLQAPVLLKPFDLPDLHEAIGRIGPVG